jgi:three-Cys-motif partner protein
MLASYLPAFTTASQKSPRTLYLDLFAGQARNLSRTTGEPISGSPRVALDCTPPFSKVVLFELPAQVTALESELRSAYPGRDLEIIAGDCNEQVGPALAALKSGGWDWAPTFALLDQHAAEIRWSTLERISTFKRSGRPKVELWLLFAPSMLPRGLASVDPRAVERFEGRITAMYGAAEWKDAYQGRQLEKLTAQRLRDELLNLIRWRLEKVLGYRVTHSFEMKNTKGQVIYNMVFATDHPAGETIMNHIYGKAAQAQPAMRAAAVAKLEADKEAKSGAMVLFAPVPKAFKPAELY